MNSPAPQINLQTSLATIKQSLKSGGWILLRDEGYTSEQFSRLLNQLCQALTFDPARNYADSKTQKVAPLGWKHCTMFYFYGQSL